MLGSRCASHELSDIEYGKQSVLRAALLETHAHLLPDLGNNPVKGSNRIMGIDLGTSTTHDLGHLGVWADHGNRCELLALQRKHLLLILEEDNTLCTCLTYQRAMFR